MKIPLRRQLACAALLTITAVSAFSASFEHSPMAPARPGAADPEGGLPRQRALSATAEPSKPPSKEKTPAPAPPSPSPAPPSPSPAPPDAAEDAGSSPPLEFDLPDVKKLEPVPDNLFATPEKTDPDQAIIELSAEALEAYVTFFPARSTRIGVKSYDAFLGDYRKASIDAFLGSCKGYLVRADKLNTAGFTEGGRVERDALRIHLRSMIRAIESLSVPTRDPNFYVDESAGAIQEIIDRDEESALKKIDHLLARLSIFPKFFTVARQNIEACPRPLLLRAIARMRASAPLFQKTVVESIRQSGHPAAATTGTAAATGSWKQIEEFAGWLEKERLPRATAPAPVGDKGWREWLSAREDTALSPAQVLAAAQADLARLKDELKTVVSKAFPGKTPAQAVAEVSQDRFEPSEARAAAETTIGELWGWMVQARLMEPPSDEMPIEVREAPAFRRRDAPLKADLPGGYADLKAPAFLEIAAPNPDWPAPILTSWLSEYGHAFLPVSLAREVYPGRFLAWQGSRKAKIRTCRAVVFPTAREGWNLYAEELAVREGFQKGDSRVKIAMLTDLIRADARLAAGVRLHTLQLANAEAASWLAQEGFWPREVAAYEVERLLLDLDAGAPALGRLALLALRDDVKKSKGASFSPREFHDRLLSFGSAPVSAVRKVMLPGDARSLLSAPK